ncbi:hypothetical protein GGF31_004303 [Allomyces arbusculus]|nr:hypothetical protein GGF31_004303 [Allomyces arbusculus]
MIATGRCRFRCMANLQVNLTSLTLDFGYGMGPCLPCLLPTHVVELATLPQLCTLDAAIVPSGTQEQEQMVMASDTNDLLTLNKSCE